MSRARMEPQIDAGGLTHFNFLTLAQTRQQKVCDFVILAYVFDTPYYGADFLPLPKGDLMLTFHLYG